MNDCIRLRSVVPADDAFLFGVFCAADANALQLSFLPAEQSGPLLAVQFAAKLKHYRGHYAAASFDIIEVDGVAAGYIFAQRGPDTFRLIDIALLPDCRNQGVATGVVKDLIESANAIRKPLHACVLKGSPAWRLWQRLGFRVLADDGVFLNIER